MQCAPCYRPTTRLPNLFLVRNSCGCIPIGPRGGHALSSVLCRTSAADRPGVAALTAGVPLCHLTVSDFACTQSTLSVPPTPTGSRLLSLPEWTDTYSSGRANPISPGDTVHHAVPSIYVPMQITSRRFKEKKHATAPFYSGGWPSTSHLRRRAVLPGTARNWSPPAFHNCGSPSKRSALCKATCMETHKEDFYFLKLKLLYFKLNQLERRRRLPDCRIWETQWLYTLLCNE